LVSFGLHDLALGRFEQFTDHLGRNLLGRPQNYEGYAGVAYGHMYISITALMFTTGGTLTII
jgi:hypothetical protein